MDKQTTDGTKQTPEHSKDKTTGNKMLQIILDDHINSNTYMTHHVHTVGQNMASYFINKQNIEQKKP